MSPSARNVGIALYLALNLGLQINLWATVLLRELAR